MSEKNNKTINGQKIFCLACMGLMAVASVVLVIMLFTSGLLNKGIVWAITGGLALLNGLHIWLQLGKGKVHVGKTVCGVIALLLTAAMLVAMVAVGKVSGAFRDISKERKEGIYVGVYVRTDDPAKELKDVSGYLLGIAAQPDRDNTLRALKDMEDAVGMVEEKELDSSVELVSALLSGDVDAMLLNEAFLDTLEETDGLTNLSDQVKLIHEFYYAQEPEQVVPANTNVLTDSYIIYLSGSDARSTDVSVRARSDTNILAVVNPATHRILLVNTPRDYYVPLARNGQMDKLTHAGIYGIEESIATLVFDEVDTGVSGRAAQKVAEKLTQVARHKQVLCVTHLPQLAAMADTHFSVEKGESGGRTFTRVIQLDREARKARITGGSQVTPALLERAGELLDQADAYRKQHFV